MIAVKKKDHKIAKLLLRAGADPNIAVETNDTVLPPLGLTEDNDIEMQVMDTNEVE